MTRTRSLGLGALGLAVLVACGKIDAPDTAGDLSTPPYGDQDTDTDTSPDTDEDGDGVLAEDDCDDQDASVGAVDSDADCDGVLTEDDADDQDAEVGPGYGGTGRMRRIPAGTVGLGCTAGQADCGANESPVMPVTLTRAYWMGETEVTQGEYEAVMGSNPASFAACGSDCPVESVNFHMAAAFANAVSVSAGLMECYACTGSGEETDCSVAVDPYTCAGFRLPTEAEWEVAARCGDDLRYAGSDTLDDVSWSVQNSELQTHPVAGKAPNACGLYDLSGNVREWTQDWYDPDYYTSSGRTDPTGAESPIDGGFLRSVRGGNWSDEAIYHRVSKRNNIGQSGRNPFYGFRLARTVL